MKHAFKLLAAAALLSSSLSALAGEFHTNCYSSAACADVAAPNVTEAFTTAFPSKKWSLFVHSTVFLLDDKVVCTATTGVVPFGSGQFPSNSYSSLRIFNEKKASLTPGEKADYESVCVQQAVTSMMSDLPKNMYRPNSLVGK